MKKYILFMLVTLLGICCAGCGNKNSAESLIDNAFTLEHTDYYIEAEFAQNILGISSKYDVKANKDNENIYYEKVGSISYGNNAEDILEKKYLNINEEVNEDIIYINKLKELNATSFTNLELKEEETKYIVSGNISSGVYAALLNNADTINIDEYMNVLMTFDKEKTLLSMQFTLTEKGRLYYDSMGAAVIDIYLKITETEESVTIPENYNEEDMQTTLTFDLPVTFTTDDKETYYNPNYPNEFSNIIVSKYENTGVENVSINDLVNRIEENLEEGQTVSYSVYKNDITKLGSVKIIVLGYIKNNIPITQIQATVISDEYIYLITYTNCGNEEYINEFYKSADTIKLVRE